MTPPFELRPLGRAGSTGETLRADPTSGLIKEERKTVVWRQTLPDGTRAVLKLYRHRKVRLAESMGLYTGRAEREFKALTHLAARGVPCSEPLFWATGTLPESGKYELLATREVPGAEDLKAWMLAHARTRPLDLAPLFALAAAAHRTGLQHGALLERNVLLADGAFYLIDFPRCQFFGRSIEGRGPGLFDLRTLVNSFLRYLPDETLVRALAGYGRLPVDPAALVRDLRAHPLRDGKLNALHAVYTVQSAVERRFARAG